jgi:neutral trehalase
MWRGPAWPNVNVLIYYGLMSYGFFQEARELARATIREITRCYMRHGCFYECYDSSAATEPADLPRKGAPGERGGAGFGVVGDLHWTAAAFVHFVHETFQ